METEIQELAHETLPVSAKYVGISHPDAINGWISTQVAFTDYSRMAVHHHKLESGRRMERPAWTLNTAMTAKVIVRFMELRAGIRHPSGGTIKQRIRRAEARIREVHLPRLRESLAEFCKRYTTAKGDEREKLAILIQNTDSQILVASMGAKLCTGVISYYWHLGWDSVQTARALGVFPPHVRQICFRLNRCAKEIAAHPELAEPAPRIRTPRSALSGIAAEIAKLRAQGVSWKTIGARYGRTTEGMRALLRSRGVYRPARCGHPRSLDYAEAKRLRELGLPYAEVARRIGASIMGTYQALNGRIPGRKRRSNSHT